MNQQLQICRKLFIFILLFAMSFQCAYSIQKASVKYEENIIDYSVLNADKLMADADKYFDKYVSSDEQLYLTTAMSKYYTLSKIKPNDIYINVQLARTYDEDKKDRLAKSYFNLCYDIDAKNPYLNYYYGDFYFKRRDYRRALRYYKIAYNNGFSSSFLLNLKIGKIYEKFADIKKARIYYEYAYSLDSSQDFLQRKIKQLKSLHYEDSEYYIR